MGKIERKKDRKKEIRKEREKETRKEKKKDRNKEGKREKEIITIHWTYVALFWTLKDVSHRKQNNKERK